MRTRVKNPMVPEAYLVFYDGVLTYSGLYDTYPLYEIMYDQNNARARPQSPCDHYSVDYGGVPSSEIWYNRSPGFLGSTYRTPELFGSAQVLSRPLIEYFNESASKWRKKVQKNIDYRTKIADEVSLINNLIELPDLPDLFKSYDKLFKDWRSNNNLVSKGQSTVRNVNYLQYAFGIEPLVRDINTLVNNIKTVKDRVANLASGNYVDFSESSFDQLDFQVDPPSISSYLKPGTLSFKGSITHTAKGGFTAFIPGLEEADFQLKCLLDVIGLHPDIRTVYDAIPFSWLLDWFIPIGQNLSVLADRGWVKTQLSGFVSISTKSSGQFKLIVNGQNNPDGASWHSGKASGTFKCYNRSAIDFGRVLKPKKLEPMLPDFDLKKIAILASLAQAKASR